MGLRIRNSVSTYFLLIFMFTVQFVQSKPQQFHISSSDDFFKKHLNENPFPASSSYQDSDWFPKTGDEHRREFDANSERAARIFWPIAGIIMAIIIITIISACCCFFFPACCLAQSMAKRRNRGQGQVIFSTNGIPHYPTQVQSGGHGLGGTATVHQSNYPYGPTLNTIGPQPFVAATHQHSPSTYYPAPAAPPLGRMGMGFDTNAQPPYYSGNNPTAFPGPMTENPPPPYPVS